MLKYDAAGNPYFIEDMRCKEKHETRKDRPDHV